MNLNPPSDRLGRRSLLGALTVAGLAPAALLGAARPARAEAAALFRPALPAPTGRHPVGRTDLHLVDHARTDPWAGGPRELMVSVWYPARRHAEGADAAYAARELAPVLDMFAARQWGVPAGAVDWAGIGTHARQDVPAAGGRRPVVLFTPGRQEPRAVGTSVLSELAGHGYVVVAVDHTGDAMAVRFPGGRVVTTSPALSGPLSAEATRTLVDCRVADVRFVLDRLQGLARGAGEEQGALPAGLGRCLDLSRVGILGHSVGGTTVAEAMRRDRRIGAGVVEEGPLGYAPDDPAAYAPAVRTGLHRPFLLMGSWYRAATPVPFTHEHVPAWELLWRNSPGWKRDFWSDRAGHNSYTDFQLLVPALVGRFGLPGSVRAAAGIGDVDPEAFTAGRRACLTAFFDRHLRGLPRPVLDRTAPWPEFRRIG